MDRQCSMIISRQFSYAGKQRPPNGQFFQLLFILFLEPLISSRQKFHVVFGLAATHFGLFPRLLCHQLLMDFHRNDNYRLFFKYRIYEFLVYFRLIFFPGYIKLEYGLHFSFFTLGGFVLIVDQRYILKPYYTNIATKRQCASFSIKNRKR